MPLVSCICALNFPIGATAKPRVVQRDHLTLAEKTSSLRRSYSKEGPGSGPHEDRSCAVGTKPDPKPASRIRACRLQFR